MITLKSKRAENWVGFAGRVAEHIDNYTVPQYGDEGADQVSDWTAEDCVKQAQRYLARFGRQQRVGEAQLDLMKVAHYAQLASEKLEKLDEETRDVRPAPADGTADT